MCINQIKARTLASPGVYISIVIYPEICRFDDQAFDDTSEESERKTNFVIKKPLRPVPSQGIVE